MFILYLPAYGTEDNLVLQLQTQRSSFGFNTWEVVDLEDLVFKVHDSESESPYSCERPCLCLFLGEIPHHSPLLLG